MVQLTLRLVGVAILSALTLILLTSRRRDLKVLAAAGLTASVGAFLLTSMPHASRYFGVVIYPLTALCSTHPVWFWLFSRALFSDRPAFRRADLICVVAMALGGVLYQSALPTVPGETDLLTRSLGLAFAAASLGFACLAPLTVFLGHAVDLDARRRRIRNVFVPAVSTYLTIIVVTQTVVLLRGQATPPALVVLNLVSIDAAAAVALSTFLRFRVVNWLDVAEPSPPAALSYLERSVLARLDRRLLPERLYARPSLTVAELAGLLGTQEHVLRRVINHGLGFRNFNDFLHSHRLTEAAERLRDPQAAHLPVLTVALDAGYGSIGPFNRAFRERFGMTPTEFRRAAGPPDLPATTLSTQT